MTIKPENDILLGGVSINGDFWGVFFAPEINPFIKLACVYAFLKKCFESKDILYADVKKINTKALELNQFFGFKIKGEDDDFYILELKKADLQIKNKKIKDKLESFKCYFKKAAK